MHYLERDMSPIGFGSTVRLKSGGPLMLVVDIAQHAVVITSWLDVHGEPIEAKFKIPVLMKVKVRDPR